MTKDKMTDLQKQIESYLERTISLIKKIRSITHFPHFDSDCVAAIICKHIDESSSIIKQLQEENNAYISCLRKINSCDDSATQQSKEAHQVLKQFGKL